MGIKRWFGERWANFTYIPPYSQKIEREMKWREYIEMAWFFAGLFLLTVSPFAGGMVIGLVMWDMVWSVKVAMLGMSPKQLTRDCEKRWKRPRS